MTLACHVGNETHGCTRAPVRGGRGRPAGFTLVELLVVIGIIAVMIGILLPTLNRARESARQSKCLNNMRQITTAAMMFATEHQGWMVGRAGGNIPYNPQTGRNPFSGAVDIRSPGNWIAWERRLDPVTGLSTPGNADQNITYSALAKYMSVKQKIHTTPQEANQVSQKLEEIFRCPSDNLFLRDPATSSKAYRYSYSMNDLFLPGVGGQPQPPDVTDYTSVPANLPKGQRNGFIFNGKIGSIRRASEHVLLVCQDEQRIDDGVFKPNAAKWANNIGDHVSARHESKFKPQKSSTGGQNVNARGNVGFCDGHAEYLSRKEAISQRYSGHPLPDPANF